MSKAAPEVPKANNARFTAPDDPRRYLLPYQERVRSALLEKGFSYVAWLASRQVGKDFTGSAIAVEDCMANPGTGWAFNAPSERQSLLTLEQCKVWVEGWKLKIDDIIETRSGRTSETLLKSAEIVIADPRRTSKNPIPLSRIIAQPGNPDTVRGNPYNQAITEADFLENPLETKRALFGSLANRMRTGGKAKKILVYSTPNGKSGWMWDIGREQWDAIGAAGKTEGEAVFGKAGKGCWKLFRTTIHDAVREGLISDPEELEAALNDPEGWAQEFLCAFIDGAAILFPYEVIAGIESPLATVTAPAEFWQPSATAAFVTLGIDFGRKKDLTVAWANEWIGDYALTKDVTTLRNLPTDKQIDALRPRITRAQRVALDYTGPGVGMGDYLVKAFGEWNPAKNQFGKIELVTFTNATKVELFTAARITADAKMAGIPGTVEIREDFHSIYRTTTTAGNVSYAAPHLPGGHADRFTAWALSLAAGASKVPPQTMRRPTRSTARRRQRMEGRAV